MVQYDASFSTTEAIIESKRLAKEISEIFPYPIKMKFETVYNPLLLQQTKMYAGLSLDNNLELAEDHVYAAIERIYSKRYSFHEVIFTKALWRGTGSEDYTSKQPHTELANRIRERDSKRNFNLGERIS